VPKRANVRVAVAVFASLLLPLAGNAHADSRCPIELQNNVCADANPNCPVVAGAGLATTAWPGFQYDRQHTGKSPNAGPACGQVLWTSKIRGKILSTAAIGPAAPGQHGTLYVAAAKYPICALAPADGSVLWCDTDNIGKLPDYSAPTISNDGMLYVGTRDNDLWAIRLPVPEVPPAHVEWRQKICTDGDVTTPPTIGSNGVVYMGSDSLGGGSLFAMCPGPTRQVKWCQNPVGGGIKNVSPALNAAGDRLYVTFSGAFLAAYDPSTGAELWRVELEGRRNGQRAANFTPVVHPVTGKIYVGFDDGVWEVTEQIDPQTNLPIGVANLLFATNANTRERIQAPPALDVANGRLFFGASRGQRSTFYAINLSGGLIWSKNLGRGRFRNLPPVVDANGKVYAAIKKSLFRLNPTNGNVEWQLDLPRNIFASPIVGLNRLYFGTTDGTVYAIGCTP
jgi:outer membrane protein assembly factor BamB